MSLVWPSKLLRFHVYHAAYFTLNSKKMTCAVRDNQLFSHFGSSDRLADRPIVKFSELQLHLNHIHETTHTRLSIMFSFSHLLSLAGEENIQGILRYLSLEFN